jgi:hypothetical protein
VTREDALTIAVAAMEQDDQCCHSGSPRGISVVYCYIPVPAAARAVVDALIAEGMPVEPSR